MSIASRVRIEDVRVLSDDWYVLKKTTFQFRRSDGSWQRLNRETYDRGNGATILLYDLARRTVLLTRQFRFPAFVNGHDDLLIEAPAGLLDGTTPDRRIRAETEEEIGFRIQNVRKVFEAFMSPGSVTEKLYFFVGEYRDDDRIAAGGGNAAEGEDIETMELTIDRALEMIGSGDIQDGKTIMLLQYAALNTFPVETPKLKQQRRSIDAPAKTAEKSVPHEGPHTTAARLHKRTYYSQGKCEGKSPLFGEPEQIVCKIRLRSSGSGAYRSLEQTAEDETPCELRIGTRLGARFR